MQAIPSHHVYELRLYQANEGKMDVLIARFAIILTLFSSDII